MSVRWLRWWRNSFTGTCKPGVFPYFYQPQVDEKGWVCGAEALLRWKFRGTPLPPPLVIKLAREAGIYGDLTDCILDTAVGGQRPLPERPGPASHGVGEHFPL